MVQIIISILAFTSFVFAIEREIDKPQIYNSRTLEGKFNSAMIFLAQQLEKNLTEKTSKNCPIIITTFVDLHNYERTTSFGRAIKENLQHEFQVRDWNVIDMNLSTYLFMNEKGEFMLTRKAKESKRKKGIILKYIIVGTYTVLNNSVLINAKMIRYKTGKMVSSAQAVLPLEVAYSIYPLDNIEEQEEIGVE